MKRLSLPVLLLLTLIAICFLRPRPAADSTGKAEMTGTSVVAGEAEQEDNDEPMPIASDASALAEEDSSLPDGRFSPEMERLVQGIHSGVPLTLRVGDRERSYMFRPKQITADGFRISAGVNADYAAAFEVFEGREVLDDGSLSRMAKLAVVNDTLSIAYTTEGGDFLIERTDDGKLVSRTLLSREADSTWGQFACAESGGRSGAYDLSGDSARPPVMDVEISLAGAAADEPPKEGAIAAHPYFRLGAQYDASLKDILILMVSSKSRTGTNLSAKAAQYFTYAATAADVYERQLGLRYLLQELVLIPSNSTEDDIEPAVNDANDEGDDDLLALKTWIQTHRPQSTCQWGHAMGWTLVEGNQGGYVGWAWLDSYGSASFGYSVNEPEWTWGVHIHELGHNVGASHTSGGAMNPTVSKSNPQESFFTQSQSGAYTAAKDIHNYMGNPNRQFVSGPAALRHPDEMPFGVDDAVSTPADTPVTFNPLTNDLAATPLFGQNNSLLSLVEIGQVFPKAAGTAIVSDDDITFTPAGGFAGNVWFTYTLGGDVGNGGAGWLHSADIVITVSGNSSNPSQNPTLSTTDDIVEADFTGSIRINPLLNDEGKGRLWAGGVDALSSINGNAESYSDGTFHLVGAQIISGSGSLYLETADMSRNGTNAQGNTGYLVYTPGINEPGQVEIQYTVEDADGNQSTGTIYLNPIDPREIKAMGAIIGTPGSYNNSGNTKEKVFDADLGTFYDAANTSGDWVGLDLGGPRQITRIKYAPRGSWPSRMVGGQFQGSNTEDFSSGAVTFHTISNLPVTGVLTQVLVGDAGTYRYIRYIGPDGGSCNVAEVELYTEAAPAAPTGLVAMVEANGDISLDWNDNGEVDLASYNVYRSSTSGSYGDQPVNVATSNYTDTTVVNGTTYYYTVTAVDDETYESTKSNQVSATPTVNEFAPVVDAGPDRNVTISSEAPWTPANLATVAGWYDASDAATITRSDDSVSVWADKRGPGVLDLTQSNASLQPKTGIHTIGGLAAIKFDGSDDTLVSNSNPFGPTIGDAMVIAVHRVDAATNGTLFNLSGTSANSGRWQAHAPFGSTLYFDAGGTGGGARVSTSYGVSTGDAVLVSFYSSSAESTQQVYKNGSFLIGDASGQNTATVGNITVGSSVGTQYQNTSIGEMIMINSTVSIGDRQKLEGYLAHKWGLAASLPAAHPYMAAAPGGSGVVVNLDGTVTDADGTTPPIIWTLTSGPDAVTFANPSAVDTTATFTEPGTYVLRLSADDGAFQSFDEITIVITEDGGFADGGIDSDGDGVLDFFEYLYGSNPNDASDNGFRIVSEPSDSGDGVVFRWEVLAGFVPGDDYRILISTDLSAWEPLPVEHYSLGETTVGDRTNVELSITHDYGDSVFLILSQP